MMAYFKLQGLCALYFECNKELTKHPFFAMRVCKGETIIDMPYCRMVYTPAPQIAMTTGSRIDDDDDTNKTFFTTAQRVTED